MVKRDSDDYMISESGNWNTAADYSKIKLMQPLDNCDVYENMATFGFDSILDQLMIKEFSIDYLRLVGFQRLVKELLKIINNARFALKKHKSLEDAEKYEKDLKRIWKIIPKLCKRTNNTEVKLIQPAFDRVLEATLEIKSLINKPLNQNDLIFTSKEEVDLDKMKKAIFKNATTRG